MGRGGGGGTGCSAPAPRPAHALRRAHQELSAGTAAPKPAGGGAAQGGRRRDLRRGRRGRGGGENGARSHPRRRPQRSRGRPHPRWGRAAAQRSTLELRRARGETRQRRVARVRLEHAAHADERARDAHPHGPLAEPERGRELVVLEPVLEPEHDERAVSFGQPVERAQDRGALREPVAVERGLIGVEVGIGRGVVDRARPRVALPRPQVVDAAVARDREEPRPRRGVPAERRERADRLAEDLLGHVLGRGSIAHHRRARREHVGPVRDDERRRRAAEIARLNPARYVGSGHGAEDTTNAAPVLSHPARSILRKPRIRLVNQKSRCDPVTAHPRRSSHRRKGRTKP